MKKTFDLASNLQTSLNPKTFVINIVFYLVFIGSEILFFSSYTEELGASFLITQFFYEAARLSLEFLIIYLATLFGRSVNVKSQVTSNGDLVILGENEL
jgi:hypothetical protein